jgi:hypothetical protein
MLRRATILGLLTLAHLAVSQTHKVAAPEKVTRALAVYEYTGDLEKPDAARLVPISIFTNGEYNDAGVYLAKPVPLALDTGIVYSIERAGEAIGTLDLDYARNIVTRRSASDDNPVGVWYGYGRFISPAEEAKLTKPRSSAKLPVVVSSSDSANPDDDRPKFIRRQPTGSTTDTTTPGTTSSSKKDTASTSPEPDDDPDRPTLRHRDPSTDDAKKKHSNKPTGYVSGPSTSLNDDPDRPNLHRGIPKGVVTPSQLTGTPMNLHQVVAISDAANRDTHLFNREWANSAERTETLTAIETLAQPHIAKYIRDLDLVPAPSKPVLSTGAQHTGDTRSSSAAKPQTAHTTTHTTHPLPKTPATPAFTSINEHLSGYFLTYGGLPTFIYTTEVPLALAGPNTTSGVIYATFVAQRLPSGKFQLALANITDASRLDNTPWLRPIDVVDADWSHRGSLLFESRGQSTRQFALYQLVSAEAEQTFITGVIE